MAPKRWTDAMVQAVAQRRAQGETLARIGADYGVQAERIRQVMIRYERTMRKRQKATEYEERLRVLRNTPRYVVQCGTGEYW